MTGTLMTRPSVMKFGRLLYTAVYATLRPDFGNGRPSCQATRDTEGAREIAVSKRRRRVREVWAYRNESTQVPALLRRLRPFCANSSARRCAPSA